MDEEFFRQQYRIPSSRMQDWDYGQEALYFVTVCTSNRLKFFGKISEDEMILSPLGEEVLHQWRKTPGLRPDMNIELDECIVMPNHFHGLIGIGKGRLDKALIPGRDARHGVSTTNEFGPQRKNLGSVVRGFKSGVTCFARKNNFEFRWQEGYYEHIVRDEVDCSRIRQYIMENVSNWSKDPYRE